MTLNTNLFSKYRKGFFSATSIVLIIVGLINLYFLFNITPRSNDECIWHPEKLKDNSISMIFRSVKFEGVTWNAGIRDGDRLLEINGVKVNDPQDASVVFDNIAKGDTVTYTVSRNGHLFETKFQVKKLLQYGGIGSTLLALIWVIVAYVVVMAKSKGETQLLFFKIGLGYTLISLTFFYAGSAASNPLFRYVWFLIILDILSTVGVVLVPFWVVKFFWIFPQEFRFVRKKVTNKIFSIAPPVILTLLVLYKIVFIYTPNSNNGFYATIYGIISTSIIGTGFLTGTISLFINYLKLESPKEKTPIFIILMANVLGVAVSIYTSTFANVFADTIFNSPEYFTPILLIVIVPIAFGYSIFRYSLMDVSDVVKNAVIYGAATLSIAGLYFFIIYLLGQTISRAIGTEYQGAIAGVVFILFAMVFQSTKDRFQDLLTEKFYPEQFAYQKVLLRFSNDISSIVGLSNILKETRETFIESLKLDRFGILLKKENGNIYILEKGHGFFNSSLVLENTGEPIAAFLDSKISLKQLPIIDRSEFEKIFHEGYNLLIEEGIYTIIPLKIKSKVIGLLVFGLKYSGAEFAGKDLQLLVAASNQVAVAIENARLYQSENQKIRLEADLENARKIQENLLPKEIPQIKNLDIAGIMIPAQHVAGDYYDLIKISDTKLFVITGDVSGKGLAASFYMTKLQTMVRLFCKEDSSPKDILINLNKLIFNEIGKNWFITVTIALFDTEKNNVKFCRAGHTPILLYSNSETKLYQPKGIGVGLEKGYIFDSNLVEIELKLNQNDLFLFYSDGVNEAMNKDDELFELDRVKEIVVAEHNKPAKIIVSAIENSLKNFRDIIEPNDDITIVAVKVI